MTFTPKFLATAIGSMPFEDPAQAVDLVLESIPQAPIWPQLPKRSLHEQMEIQYSEGLPRIVVEEDKRRMYFDTTGDYSEELAGFYEAYIEASEGEGSFEPFKLGQDYAAGLYELETRLAAGGKKPDFVKVQTTGPISFALTITDQDKRAIYYNEEFLDVVVKSMAMKSRWQIKKFAPLAEKIICFVDEPILSAFGSSTYVSVTRDDVVARLGEVIEAVHAEGALAGVHCCGNTEWSILVDAGADIVNFDAFCYGETILMYPEALKGLLTRGGSLAFGLVPTSSAVREVTAESLADLYDNLAGALAAKGIERALIDNQTIVTPSCGTGSLPQEDAERVFAITGQVSRLLKQRHGF